jgi:hypothetical protein
MENIVEIAKNHILNLKEKQINIISINSVPSFNSINQFVKITSKLSPIIGNFIEYNIVEILNENLKGYGNWVRQDPKFPDAFFRSSNPNIPDFGFEIKAWYPFSTEISARFRESQKSLLKKDIDIIICAWLPNKLITGNPLIINIGIVSALELAKSRDNHYYDPPRYLVVEPNDTSSRKSNLQQTNTQGYKFQDQDKLQEAINFVESWDDKYKRYSIESGNQEKILELKSMFSYREDSNFGKIDRLGNEDIDKFHTNILNSKFLNKSLSEWKDILNSDDEDLIKKSIDFEF